MIEGFETKKKHRHVKEIPLAPVLDLLVVVIFFLILSSSFVQFNKQTLPPSAVSSGPASPASTDSNEPLNPKMMAVRNGARIHLLLMWGGKAPGQETSVVAMSDDDQSLGDQLQLSAGRLAKNFKTRFPTEANLQLGLGPDLTYQNLVSLMDGAREYLENIVLVSDADATAIEKGRWREPASTGP